MKFKRNIEVRFILAVNLLFFSGTSARAAIKSEISFVI